MLLRLSRGRQGVGRFARLRDRHGQHALVVNREPVPALGRDERLGRHLRPFLDEVLADHAGMTGRAAGEERHPLDDRECAVGQQGPTGSHRTPVIGDIVAPAPRDDGGLLADFLEHEVRIAAAIDALGRGGDRPPDPPHRLAREAPDFDDAR